MGIDEFPEMSSKGHSNTSPWNCPRDIREEKSAEKMDTMVARVRNVKNYIFNFHCPPYDRGLDTAPELKELKPIGQMVPGALRRVIERCQPMLSLYGHIHEARGFRKIGRILCLNARSAYSEGILRGIVEYLTRGSQVDYRG